MFKSAFEVNPLLSTSIRCSICAQFYPDSASNWILRKSAGQHLRSEKHNAASKLVEERNLAMDRRRFEAQSEAQSCSALNSAPSANFLPPEPPAITKPPIYEWEDLYADALGNEYMFSAGVNAPELEAGNWPALHSQPEDFLEDSDSDLGADVDGDDSDLLSNVAQNLRDMGTAMIYACQIDGN